MESLHLTQFTIRETRYAPGLRLQPHSHDYSNVTIVLSGEIEEVTDCGEHLGRSASVVVKPAGVEHRNHVSGLGARTLTIELQHGSPFERAIATTGWRWLETSAVVREAISLQRLLSAAGGRAMMNHVESQAVSLLTAALETVDTNTHAPLWIAEVKRMLAARFDEPIRFDNIAHELGLHPVYVSRAFHRHTGITMHEYLRTLRARHARHLLSASQRSVAGIASTAGFTDASHLCRTFADCFGVTPKVYRRLFRQV